MVISSRLILAQFIAHIGRTACADVAAPPRKRFRLGAALCVAALACGACRAPDSSTLGTPGAPLPGLTAGELLEFQAGRALFEREFAAGEGLGPAFNESRCSACHDVPTTGGMGAELVNPGDVVIVRPQANTIIRKADGSEYRIVEEDFIEAILDKMPAEFEWVGSGAARGAA